MAPSDYVCPECKADDEGGVDAGFDDATPNICAVQYKQPNEVNNFTVCQLLRHNCQQPNNAFAQILSTECPPPYMQLPCDEQTECSPNSALTADTPVCGETFVTKLKQRFDNECAMHRANCLYPMNGEFSVYNCNWIFDWSIFLTSTAYTIIPCTDNEVNQINDPLTI